MAKPSSPEDMARIVAIIKDSQETRYNSVWYQIRLVFGENWPEAEMMAKRIAETYCPISSAKDIESVVRNILDK